MKNSVSDRSYLIKIAHRYLIYCFENESAPRVKELARLCGMSRSAFSRKFASIVGVSPSQELKRQQVQNALRLMRLGLPTNLAAYRSGYGSRRTLFRALRRTSNMH